MNTIELLRSPHYQDFVKQHVILNQTSLVENLLSEENSGITHEQIINAYDETEGEYRNIFEWWICSPWLLAELEERGEPVLKTDLGQWWGRGTTGQAVRLDCVLQEIWQELEGEE